MFEDLRQAFREAIENFKRELNRDQVPEAVDRLVVAMRRELADATADLERLKDEIRATLESAGVERTEAATCRRRAQMALGIGDEDTVEVARDFAEKHERRADVLERKALALREELSLREAEVEEMTSTVQEAIARRSDLAARMSRTSGRRTIQEADRLFEELSRMGEHIEDLQARADAAEALSAEPSSDAAGANAVTGLSPEELERRLQELKRHMESS